MMMQVCLLGTDCQWLAARRLRLVHTSSLEHFHSQRTVEDLEMCWHIVEDSQRKVETLSSLFVR